MLLKIPYKSILKEIVILLSFSAVTALIVNHFSPGGIALFGEWDVRKGVISAKSKNDVVDHEIEIQDVTKAKKIYDSGEALFVDARPEDIYNDGHIKGSLSLPVHLFDERINAFIADYPETAVIITYCSGRECDDSHLLAQRFAESGYFHVMVFVDGYPAWEKEGYPVEH